MLLGIQSHPDALLQPDESVGNLPSQGMRGVPPGGSMSTGGSISTGSVFGGAAVAAGSVAAGGGTVVVAACVVYDV